MPRLPPWVVLPSLLGLGCGSTTVATPPITVSLSGDSFATTGSNLFNCGAPANPPDSAGLSGGGISCTPEQNSDGTFSTTPASVWEQVGCSDGHGALVVVTCGGTMGTNDINGSVSISITQNCGDQTPDPDAATFSYSNTQGMSAAQTLQSCATFSNLCSTNDPCAFNAFVARVSVTYN
jgi:hypothetical protein